MQDDHVRHWGRLHPQPILPRGAPIGPRNAQAAPPLSAAVHIRPTVPEQGGGTKATCRGTDWPRLFVDQAARGASSTRCRRVHLVLQYGATGRLTRGTEHTPAGSARPWTATPFPCHRPRAQQLTARACSSMSVEQARRSTRIPARRCAQRDVVDLSVKKYRLAVHQIEAAQSRRRRLRRHGLQLGALGLCRLDGGGGRSFLLSGLRPMHFGS